MSIVRGDVNSTFYCNLVAVVVHRWKERFRCRQEGFQKKQTQRRGAVFVFTWAHVLQ